MSVTTDGAGDLPARRVAGARSFWRELPRWKRALFALAILLCLGGLAIEALATGREAEAGEGAPERSWPRAAPRAPAPGAETAGAPGEDSMRSGDAPHLDTSRQEAPDDPLLAFSVRGLGDGLDLRRAGGAGAKDGSKPVGVARKLRSSVPRGAAGGRSPETGAGAYGSAGGGERESGGSGMWGPSLLVGGFSFFVAFSVGCAMRVFARLVLVFCGLLGLSLAGLTHLGFVEVHWDRMAEGFDVAVQSARAGFSGVQAFLQKSLPSVAMSGLGLLAALKRK